MDKYMRYILVHFALKCAKTTKIIKKFRICLVVCQKRYTFATEFKRTSRSRAVVARQAHNLEVVGSIPSSATSKRLSYDT